LAPTSGPRGGRARRGRRSSNRRSRGGLGNDGRRCKNAATKAEAVSRKNQSGLDRHLRPQEQGRAILSGRDAGHTRKALRPKPEGLHASLSERRVTGVRARLGAGRRSGRKDADGTSLAQGSGDELRFVNLSSRATIRCASAASEPILVRGLKVRQSSAASLASVYYDKRTRARNIFILRCGTKDHVLLVPQSRQRINSGRSPCRRIASENRGA
jgi:hypothetical protein